MRKRLQKLVGLCVALAIVNATGLFAQEDVVKAAGTDKNDATQIELGENIKDAISVKTEEDWYCFTTPTTETDTDSWFKVTLLYKNKQANGYAPSIYLYDEKDKELEHISASGANEEEVEYVKLEQEKIYYALLTSECKNDTADYIFSFTELPDEAGDVLENANDLTRNMTNRFELQSPDDEDWFYVEADNTKPSITLKNPNIVSFHVDIYDIDGTKLDDFSVGRGESETKKLSLLDKNFYIKVYTEYSTDETVGNYTIAVNDKVEVTKVELNKSKASLKIGKTLTLKAAVTPSSATDKKVTWKSSNTKVATVDENGKVKANRAGVVTITCIVGDESGKKATCKITVK